MEFRILFSFMGFWIFVSPTFAQTKSDTLFINNTAFITQVKPIKAEFNGVDTAMFLYRIENGKSKYLLKHYIYKWSADCNNEFIDMGSFYIQGDSLIFITNYTQKLHDPIPLSRKQIYVVQSTGKLLEIYDKTEDYDGKWEDTGGNN